MLLFLPLDALAERQVLHGHVPAAVADLQPLSDLDASKPMDVLIGLPLRNEADLAHLLVDLYNPTSTNYQQYLSPAQFTEQFGPTREDYQSVIAFAKSNGLTLGEMFANRTLLQVHGTVADLERVFQIRLRVYPHPSEGRTFFAPDREPSVDLAVPLLAITGLDSFVLPHPQNLRPARSHPAQPMAGSAPSGNYWGKDFRTAYVPGTSLTGAGQNVGLFELDGYYPADIASYESQAGLASVPLSNFLLDGASGSAGSDNDEVALDIEMTIAMAPGLSGVLVYEGPNVNNITSANMVLNCMATNNAAKQLSCSWGFSINASTVSIFQQFATQGQSFFLASGDTGAFTGAASPPSDDPYITVVGGTTLTTTGPGGSWVSEKVWNWFTTGEGTGASTGGISTTYTIPSWQAPVSMALNQGSTSYRNIPDVAMTADNVWVIYGDGESGEFGGTSCAAPLWAAFTALVNEQGVQNARSSVGFLNPALYTLGLGSSYAATFHDITVGNDTNASIKNEFFAVAGYDLCTGWGTPNGTNLINALAPSATTPVVVATATLAAESCLPTNGAIDPGETVTLNLTLTNTSAVGATNLVATLQSSSALLQPSGPQTYGALAQGRAAVTKPFTFTASGTCGEAISIVWQIQNGTVNLGSVSFTYNLGELISDTTLSQNFDGVTAPALPANWSTSTSGSQVNWYTTTVAYDTGPYSAFATDSANPGVAYLLSPVVNIVSSDAQLTFRQNYDLEYETLAGTTYYFDGGVLDIAIGSGSFTDILSAGGSFVTGGYNGTLYASSGNPLARSSAWGGNSGGWITTTINLPAAAAGQNVQFRWACATDESNDSTVVGWYVDTISLKDAYYSCCESISLAIVPGSVNLTAGGVFSLSITSVTGVTYSLQYKNYLTDASWTTLPASAVTGTGNVITLQDISAPQTQRFYRVLAN
jgi:subtilase family serine protease